MNVTLEIGPSKKNKDQQKKYGTTYFQLVAHFEKFRVVQHYACKPTKKQIRVFKKENATFPRAKKHTFSE